MTSLIFFVQIHHQDVHVSGTLPLKNRDVVSQVDSLKQPSPLDAAS